MFLSHKAKKKSNFLFEENYLSHCYNFRAIPESCEIRFATTKKLLSIFLTLNLYFHFKQNLLLNWIVGSFPFVPHSLVGAYYLRPPAILLHNDLLYKDTFYVTGRCIWRGGGGGTNGEDPNSQMIFFLSEWLKVIVISLLLQFAILLFRPSWGGRNYILNWVFFFLFSEFSPLDMFIVESWDWYH